MTTSADLIAQVGAAVSELNTAKNKFEEIREDTEVVVSGAKSSLDAWKVAAFQSDEANGNVWRGSQTIIDLTHLSTGLMYPVVLKGSSASINHYEISRDFAGVRQSGAALAGLFFKCSWVGDAWGGNPISLVIDRSEQTYVISMGAAGYVAYFHAAVFLRGGYQYHLRSSNAAQIHTVYEVETVFYQDIANPQNDVSVGPITPENALILTGALTNANLYNVAHNHDLTGVGETNAN